MTHIVQYNPACYLIQPSTGLLHIVPKDDLLRKRNDLREPTQAEVDAHYARVRAFLNGEPIEVTAPVEVHKPKVLDLEFEAAEEIKEAIEAKKRRGRAEVKVEEVPEVDSTLDDVV